MAHVGAEKNTAHPIILLGDLASLVSVISCISLISSILYFILNLRFLACVAVSQSAYMEIALEKAFALF